MARRKPRTLYIFTPRGDLSDVKMNLLAAGAKENLKGYALDEDEEIVKWIEVLKIKPEKKP